MVVIQLKHSEKNFFFCDASTSQKVEDVQKSIFEIANQKLILEKLILSVQDLIEHGPLRPEALRGLTTPETYNPAKETLKEEELKYVKESPRADQLVNPDKTGFRTGFVPSQSIQDKIKEVLQQAQNLIDPKAASSRKLLNLQAIKEYIDLIQGCVMIAHPGYHDLPPWDPA